MTPAQMPAYQADSRPCSREDFYAQACNPARSVVVQACAGAGKTWMLVSRVLRALLDGAAPHEVLAITFTRKAAGEMRQRLDDWLLEFSNGADDAPRVQALVDRGLSQADAKRLAPRLAGLRAQVLHSDRGVQVHTFHAWFAQLMRAAPIELLRPLGLQPGLALLEDTQDWHAPLLRRLRRQLLAEPTLGDAYRLLVVRHGRSRVNDWLLLVLNKRVELELADEAGVLHTAVPPAAQVFPACAAWAQPLLRMTQDSALRQCLSDAARALGAASGKRAQGHAAELVDALAQTDPSVAFARARKALFTDGQPRKAVDLPEVQPALQALDDLQSQASQQAAHEDHGAMLALSRALLAQWQALKLQQGLADMGDLERVALAVLSDADLSGWVLQRLDTRVRHLLIDEFQDTSPLQWHALLGWLGSYAGAGGGASGQRPPSVFIVGDPKQSIYRFRRAEPRVFDAAQEFVVHALDGVALSCDHTRRNATGVVAVLNQVFDTAAQAGDYSGFRPHSTEVGEGGRTWALPLVPREPGAAKSKGGADATPTWRDSLITPRNTVREKNAVQEARQLARAVQQLMAQHAVAPGEVMVLARRRASLALAAQALRECHIPCVAAEDLALAAQPEVADLVALLDVLASPAHDLSLARALRSPLFGVDDAGLLALSLRARSAGSPWWAALQGWADAPAELARARDLLAAWGQAAQMLPPHDLLDRVLHQGDAVARLLAATPAPRRALADLGLRALIGQTLALDGARYATPYNFVRALKGRVLKLKVPARSDAVQLLTVHGAKGLEARAVFIIDTLPNRQTDSDPTLLVDWPVHLPRPRQAAFLSHASRCPPSLQALDAAEQAERAREELNGLYVAMTRAREWLVLSAHEPHQAAPGLSWWERLLPSLQTWPLAGEATAADAPARPAAMAEPLLQVPVLPALSPGRLPILTVRAPADHPEQADLGTAVHRMLEWATRPGSLADRADLARAAAQACGLPPAQALQVQQAASRVLDHPDFAPFIDPDRLAWAGNEVPLSDGLDSLRLDRLVRLKVAGGAEWWVLDYKLATRPQELATYREQMARYRRVLAALLPGEVVRAALVSGDGRVIELGDAASDIGLA